MELLKIVAPNIRRVGVLHEKLWGEVVRAYYSKLVADLEATARTLKIQITVIPMGGADSFDRVEERVREERVDTLFVASNPFMIPQDTPFEALTHMLDIVATAIARCKLQVLSIFLTYLLSSGIGIFMVHSGNLLALGERDRIVATANASEPAALSERSGHHLTAALQDFAANLIRAAVPQTILGLGVFPPYISVAYQGWVGGIVSVDRHHRSRLKRPGAAAYYFTVLLLQFVPFSLAIGAGVRAGLDLYSHNAHNGWNLRRYKVPHSVLETLLGAYVLATPLFLLASAVEYLWSPEIAA